MRERAHGVRGQGTEQRAAEGAAPRGLKVISWNLLRLIGAGARDVALLIEQQRPDLLLMQEATEDLASLPAMVGGSFFREPMHGRIYGLAVWSPHKLAPPRRLALPVSTMPGHVPPRVAQIVRVGNISFANVHLSHGQFLNRWQLLHIARSLEGPAAVVGDYNAVGPIGVPGLRDVGPRQPTHLASNIIALRLDRCMVRGLRCTSARVLERGPSDHRPILLELDLALEAKQPSRQRTVRGGNEVRLGGLRLGVESWLRAVSRSGERIGVARSSSDKQAPSRRRRRLAEGRRLAHTEDRSALQ